MSLNNKTTKQIYQHEETGIQIGMNPVSFDYALAIPLDGQYITIDVEELKKIFRASVKKNTSNR